MLEYRPCIVTETIEPENTHGTIEYIKHKALFHQWIKSVVPMCEYNSKKGKRVIGSDEVLSAMVEYEDGTIHECTSQMIRFVDNKVSKSFFDIDIPWNKLTDYTDNYPESYNDVLFKTSDGRIYYGFCDCDYEWKIELKNEETYKIKDVVEWRHL